MASDSATTDMKEEDTKTELEDIATDFQKIGWLPSSKLLREWLDSLEWDKNVNNWDETVQMLHSYILHTGPLAQGTHEMISENVKKHAIKPGFRSLHEMCGKLNTILKTTPQYSQNKKGQNNELIGVPMAALFWHVATNPPGMAIFLSSDFNKAIKEVLNKWKSFLDSKESFTKEIQEGANGWLSDEAKTQYTFDDYETNLPNSPYWNSWNDFFTRSLKPGKRKFAGKNDDKHCIVQLPNDGTSFRLSLNVQLRDEFWLKDMPYSLQGIFGYDYREYAKHFVNGSIFQSYLDPFNYHCYHTPVSGIIKVVDVLEGAYFPQLVWQYGIPDRGAGTKSLPWLASVNARGLIIIDTKNYANIGLVCLLAIGMGDVSSVNWYPKIGDTVKIGEKIGCFKFGGSSICVINEDVQKYKKKLTYNQALFDKKTGKGNQFQLGEILATVS